MAHLCKCAVCEEQFDRDKIQAVRYGARRYAHQTCYPEGEIVPLPPPKPNIPRRPPPKDTAVEETKEEKESRKDLLDYISEVIPEPNYARIQLQINEFKQKYHYTYSGIKKTLMYFIEVLKGNPEKGNNAIGIVPYLYQDAYKYYLQIYNAKVINQSKVLSDFIPDIVEVTIKPPQVRRKQIQLFNLEE